MADVTHASTRGGHAYLEGQARTPSHLQITSGDVCPMPYYLYPNVFAGLETHCNIKCLFLGLGAYFGQFSSNGISFHHELMFAMSLEF